jgi:hypothetical protein
VTSWRLAAQQAAEKLGAGLAYESSGYFVVDELGQPVNPDWYSDEFQRRASAQDCRGSSCTRRAPHDQQPDGEGWRSGQHPRRVVRSHGGSQQGTYTHARPEDLATALDALSKINNVRWEIVRKRGPERDQDPAP